MISFLRWAGSKRQLLPILTGLIGDDFTRYVEPFAGSGCVFFALMPNKALLADINPELMRTYVEVKYRVADVIEQLSEWRKSKKRYLNLRLMDPKSLSCTARAARFIYLNRCCFNGLYRTNRKGCFNVPYGGKRSGKIPRSEDLQLASRVLKKAKLITSDFTETLERVEPGDFVYMDPPFSIAERRMFKEYHAACFDPEQVKRLRTEMEKLADRKIKFLVSYAESDEAKVLRTGFKFKTVAVRRNIAGFAADRRTANETLIYN
jgi:DNA adenine methylase